MAKYANVIANVTGKISGGEDLNWKPVLLLPVVIQLRYLVLSEGVCEGVGADVWGCTGKCVWRQGWGDVQAFMFRLMQLLIGILVYIMYTNRELHKMLRHCWVKAKLLFY